MRVRMRNPRSRDHLRAGSLAGLALALALGASGIRPMAAAAGAQPFPVSLSVTASAETGVDEVMVVATSVSDSRCVLRVDAGSFAKSFPRAAAGRGGVVRWRWLPRGLASDIPWRFTATCRVGTLWARRWLIAELGFPSSDGALLTSTSTAANLPGASCDVQGMCFADDPFPVGQCTWYAAGRRPDVLGIVHGNAGSWLEEARLRLPEGPLPIVGALAIWLPHYDGAGEDGHVAYVAAASEDGSILIDDSNWTPTPTSPRLQVHEHWVSAGSPSGYIYGGPAGDGPSS